MTRMIEGKRVSAEKEANDKEPIAHQNVVVITTEDAAEMDVLVDDPQFRGLIWRRLDATHALVDPTAALTMFERLNAAGISASVGELSSPGE